MVRRALLLALALCASAPGAARAADPIMPLSQVRAGMSCTGLSVVRGTEISSFDVEIIDVISDDPLFGGPRILIRVSGRAVDATGIGPGFSGSPILCGGRNAGAISEGIGEYGNHVALATPIEEILTTRPAPAAGPRRAPGLRRAARPLYGPLTVTGLAPATRRLLARAARLAGRVVLAGPPGPFGGYSPQDLRPGSAVSAAIATGDISVSASGTVAYRDGDQVFAFGHALDALGRRALFLQDTYVFGVIGNPLGVPDLGAITYKLTSSGGHVLGAFTNDTSSAIAGGLGSGPPAIPLRVTAHERGRPPVELNSLLADERGVGLGTGMSFVAPLAATSALERLLRSFEPVTLKVCARFRVAELRRPIGYCNPHFDSFPAFIEVAEAAGLVEGYAFPPLDIGGAAVSIAAKRGVVDDVLVGADARRRVRAGSRLPVRVRLRRRGGGRRSVTVRVRVPRNLRPGPRTLVLAGNGFELDEGFLVELLIGELAGGRARAQAGAAGAGPGGAAQTGPRTVRGLARRVAALERPLGITARFRRRQEPRVVLRSDGVRFDGRVRLRLRVLRARR